MPGSPPSVELDLPFGRVLPDRLRPMLPMAATEPFDSPLHVFEVAWDGIRALASVEGGSVRAWGRALRDLTPHYPEVQGLAGCLPPDSIVDGELIVGDAQGRPDGAALQERVQAETPGDLDRMVARNPVTYVIYDLLYLRGRSLLREPMQRRRALLDETLSSDGRLYVPPPIQSEGLAFFDAAREKGLGGVVAKRLDGLYHPGRRHPDWLLVQAVRHEDFVVLGFIPGRGRHPLDELVVGSFEGRGFRPVGKVTGGFDASSGSRLRRMLDGLPRGEPPPDVRWADEGMVWVDPRIVIAVKFSEWDRSGQLRFPIFSGFRPEVLPEECIRTPILDPPAPVPMRRAAIQLPTLPI